MAIRHFDEWVRTEPNGRRVHEMHAWLDLSAPASPAPVRPRRRARDANAGAIGEMDPGRPVPNGDPDAPPERRARPDQSSGPDTVGGLPEPTRTQTSEPPTFVDAKTLRVSGKDQRGRMWGASLWLPQEQPDGYLEQTGDRALADLAYGGDANVAGLGAWQRLLDRTYARRRP
jgi:hypothetical protein